MQNEHVHKTHEFFNQLKNKKKSGGEKVCCVCENLLGQHDNTERADENSSSGVAGYDNFWYYFSISFLMMI